ncbi:FtsX-like permease family protein [Streptomyces acidicola]|uniref:FtsX-like permease family protein n=1 Tax=Streptomyces acidicola TaxID=2596892 RepID=UPI0018836555|nr:FtsX-like permease family protein [Streptomyces acidicola]
MTRRVPPAGAGPVRRPVPVALREARAELPLLACLMAVTALLTAVAAASPVLLDRFAGQALASRLEQEQSAEPGIRFTAEFAPAVPGAAGDLDEDLRPVTTVIGNAVPDALDGSLVHDSTRVELPLVRTRTAAGDVGLGLVYASDAPGRGAYTEGRPPDPGAEALEIAVSTRTREALKLRLGQQLPIEPGVLEGVHGTAAVVGFFRAGRGTTVEATAADSVRGDRLSRELPQLARPAQYPPDSDSGLDWEARALVAPRTVTTLQGQSDATLTVTWGMRLDLDARTAARFADDQGQADLGRLLYQYPHDARGDYCGDFDMGMYCQIGPHPSSGLQSSSRLPDVLTEFGPQWRQGRTVISFALASLIVVGLLTTVVTALLAVRRRLAAHRLQRARGASATGLALTRAAQTAPAALLGLAAGLVTARSLPDPSPAYRYGLLVALFVWLPLPALTWHALRDRVTARGHRPTQQAGGRRIVAEATVLLLAAAGVAALRARGTTGDAGPDPLLAAVPALLGLVTVVVLVRCYPPPVRLLARWSARRHGVVGIVALSRAAKDAPARALALLVLVVTLAGAVFGGLVAGTLADGRREAAAWQVGADASFRGAERNPGLTDRLTRVSGVRDTVRVRQLRVDPTSGTSGEGYGIASLVGVDGAELRKAAPRSAAARALDTAGLSGRGPGGDRSRDIRVLATDARAGDLLGITSHGRSLRLRVVGGLPDDVLRDPALGPVRSTTTPRDRLLLADNRDLGAFQGSDFEESALLLYGPRLDVETLRSLVPRAAAGAAVGELRLLAEEEADADADGMVGVLRTAHTACTALAVLLALLALVLDLLLSAPERGRTASYLRTLGLGRHATSALHLVQLLPMVLAALVGGTALGLTLPALLGPALDLREFTGGSTDPTTHPDLLLTAALGIGLGLLVAAAVGVETWLGRRRGLGAVLRLTEER